MARPGAVDTGGDAISGRISRHWRNYVLRVIHGGREPGCGHNAARVGPANSQRGGGCALGPPYWLCCSRDCIWSCCLPVSLRLTIQLLRTASCRMLHPRGCISRTAWDSIYVRLCTYGRAGWAAISPIVIKEVIKKTAAMSIQFDSL